MNDQEEFEKWFLSNLPENTMPMMEYALRKGYSEKAWHACAEQKSAIIKQQAKELKALRGFAKTSIGSGSIPCLNRAERWGLIDESGNPTKLLTGEK